MSKANGFEGLSPYQQVEASLRQRLHEGEWAAGVSLPGRRKLAEEYGVALSTVQRAIASLLDDGTLMADGNRGTFVGRSDRPAAVSMGRHLGAGNLLRIAVVLGDADLDLGDQNPSDNEFYGPLFGGIRAVLARDNTYVHYLYRNGRTYQEVYETADCDGLIAVALDPTDLQELKVLAANDIPFVGLLTSSDADEIERDLPCVEADNRQGTAAAINYLIDLGHKEIAIVNLSISHTNLYDRFEAFIDTMAEAGLSIKARHMLVASRPWSEELFERRIEAWVEKLVESGNLPTAIFACDFTSTLKAMAALQKRGIKIPDDVSLVGFDYYPLVEHFSPPLTMVRQPVFQLGQRAATKLLDHLKTSRHRLHGTDRLPTELVVRRSCAAPRGMSTEG